MNVRAWSLAIAGLLALVFLSQGLTAPFEKDEEARPASIIVDIVHRGHWLLPDDVYGDITRKPPLYYWLSAAAAEVRRGVLDEPGARVVSLIAAAMVSMVVMGFAAAHFGAGWMAWLALLGCYGFCSHAGYARTDMLFTLFTFGAFCLLFPVIEGGQRPGNWIGAGLMLGLGTLTKGPLALVLCGLGILVYLLLMRRNPLPLARRAWPWLMLAIALAVAAVWYVPALIQSHGAIAGVQLMQENLGHLVPAQMGGTGEASRPFYYLLVRFVGTAMPLSLYLPAVIAVLWPLRKAGAAELYQLGFLIAVLGLFSLASAKRDDYILPAFPPFAILVGAMVARSDRFPAAARLRDWATLAAGLGMLASAAGIIVLSRQASLLDRLGRHLQSSDAAYLKLFAGGLAQLHEAALIGSIAAAALAALIALRRGMAKKAALAVAITAMAGVSLWIGVVRPGLASHRTYKEFALRMRSLTGGKPVFTPGGPDYEVSYYYGAPIVPLAAVGGKTAAAVRTADSGPSYVLVWDTWLSNKLWTGPGQPVLASHPASDGHRLLLLKIEPAPFEPSVNNH